MLTSFDLGDLPKHCVGVLMKDQLPKTPRSGSYITSLQSSKDGGDTHFTCLKVQDDEAVFYDPLGAPPVTEVRDFVKLSSRANTW